MGSGTVLVGMDEVCMGWCSTRFHAGDLVCVLDARTGQNAATSVYSSIADGRCRALVHDKRKINVALRNLHADPRLRKQCRWIHRGCASSIITQVSELRAPKPWSGGLTLGEQRRQVGSNQFSQSSDAGIDMTSEKNASSADA